MTSDIVLPTLSNWAEQHITTLLTNTDESAFDGLFDATFSHDVKIILNGHHISRDQYKKQIQSAKGLESGAQVAFTGAVEVPDSSDHPVNAGTVGLFLNATIFEKFLVLGAPESSTVTASFNLKIIQDPSIKRPNLPGRGGDFDPRRISAVSEVSVDKRNPFINPGGPIIHSS